MSNPTIQNLYEQNYSLLNLKQDDKLPIHSRWQKDKVEVLLMKFDLEHKGNVGLRMGKNDMNNTYIIGLDFDMCKKDKNGNYVDCKNTKELYEKYNDIVDSHDGMYQSSTIGNMNVIVDISISERLQNGIKILPCRWSPENYNLELLTSAGSQMVIPPSKTANKKTGKLEVPRTFLTENTVYVVKDDDDPIVDFICDYINDNSSKSKKTYKSKKEQEQEIDIENKEEEGAYIIHAKNTKLTKELLSTKPIKIMANDYDSFWKVAYAIYSIHRLEGKDLFMTWAKTNEYSKEEDRVWRETYWDNSVHNFLKEEEKRENYKMWCDWWLLSIIKHIDIDAYKLLLCKCILFNKDTDYSENKERLEDMDGNFRVAKIAYKGLCYTLYNPVTKSLDIVEWDRIKHATLEDFDKSFLEDWFCDKTKQKVDDVNMYPYKETPDKCINLFNGFPIKKLLENKILSGWKPNQDYIQHFNNYVARVCGGNEPNAEMFIKQLVSHIILHGRPEVCVVIQGKQGCGKGSFVRLVKALVGRVYWVDDPQGKRLFERFNSQFADKILVCIDEPDWTSMTTQMEKFKNAITEPTKTIEQKGIDAYEVDNHTSYMLTTNNRNLFKLSSDDRRFFFVSMDNFGGTTEQKGDYFDDFSKKLHDEEYLCSILSLLKDELDTNFNFESRKEACLTTYHNILKDSFDDTCPKKFIKEWLERDNLNILMEVNGKWDERQRDKEDSFYVLEDEIYNDYKLYCNGSRPIGKVSLRQEISLAQKSKCEKRPTIDGRRTQVWYISVKDLENLV